MLIALLRRYDLRPYRYPRQRHTKVMARVPDRFVNETLWPEFQELNKTLASFLAEVTERVIAQGIASDASDVEVRTAPAALPMGQSVGDAPVWKMKSFRHRLALGMRIDFDHWLAFVADLGAWRRLPASAREALLLLSPPELRSGGGDRGGPGFL